VQDQGSDLQRHVRRLITQADDQTCRQWEVVNQARRARGEPPIIPNHPFRPHELIDPCEDERDA
jgi:hypothetical protein